MLGVCTGACVCACLLLLTGGREPAWPGGKQKNLGSNLHQTLSHKLWFMDTVFVTLPLTKWYSTLPILVQESFWC